MVSYFTLNTILLSNKFLLTYFQVLEQIKTLIVQYLNVKNLIPREPKILTKPKLFWRWVHRLGVYAMKGLV